MERKAIDPWTWQKNFGYHQGHEVTGAERTLWISGQTSTDADGKVVNENDMGGQIRQALLDTTWGAMVVPSYPVAERAPALSRVRSRTHLSQAFATPCEVGVELEVQIPSGERSGMPRDQRDVRRTTVLSM